MPITPHSRPRTNNMKLTLTLLNVLLLAPVTVLHAADSRPNIVFIVSDDQGAGDYGFMGHPQVETPHLDKLAAQSLTFPRGFVPTSVCCPSLATIITGLYPHQHKVTPMIRRCRRVRRPKAGEAPPPI